MVVKMTSKRQVTFPKRVVEKLHLKAGDHLSIEETSDGILIRPRRLDKSRLAPLSRIIESNLPAPDYAAIRHGIIDPELRA